jgi:hypothetical protein
MTNPIRPADLLEGSEPLSPQESHRKAQFSETDSDPCLSRREVIRLAAGAIIASPLVGVASAEVITAEPSSGADEKSLEDEKSLRFFTPQEFALVDELTELIIPTDSHSPGARAAQVAAFIDARLAESFTDEPKLRWRNGLKMIDEISQEMNGRIFLQATTQQRVALLTRISQNEADPQKPEEHFFSELKHQTVRGYYTSKIGIHTEMEYKGNTYQKEYAGYDAK